MDYRGCTQCCLCAVCRLRALSPGRCRHVRRWSPPRGSLCVTDLSKEYKPTISMNTPDNGQVTVILQVTGMLRQTNLYVRANFFSFSVDKLCRQLMQSKEGNLFEKKKSMQKWKMEEKWTAIL